MLTFRKGDILGSDTEAVVNTVNCVGIMGRGIALQFKNAFPDNFQAYAAACKRHEVQPGRMFVFETGQLGRPRFIINFPTKRHWRGKSRIEDVEAGLKALVTEVRSWHIGSIAIPPLGSGLGGLSWSSVKPLIERAAAELPDVEVIVYEPGLAPADARANKSTDVPDMTAGRAALVALIERYLAALMDPSITPGGTQAHVLPPGCGPAAPPQVREGDLRAVRRESSPRAQARRRPLRVRLRRRG
jgi:O-acetyl-ADP-ribose deacetylase (regulator of RNase III)